MAVCCRVKSPVAFVLLAALLPVTALRAALIDTTVNASYFWTENLGRASGPADYRDAATYEAQVIFGHTRQLAPRLIARARFEVVGSVTPDFDRLNEVVFGPRLSLQRRFGLGPTAPTLGLEAAVQYREARLDLRDATLLRARLVGSKRFNSVLAFAADVEWAEDVARSNIYDVHHLGANARVMLDLHPRLRFTTGVGHRDGTFVAGASNARFLGALGGALGPEIAAYYNSIPIGVTNTFEPGWFDYRVEGKLDYWWFELSPALTDRLALAIRYERIHSVNKVNVDYRQNIFSVSLLKSF